MKKTMFWALFLLVSAVFAAGGSKTDVQDPLQYLESQFPKLYGEYKNDLADAKAHYIFAIDVSGTMKRFEPHVVPSLKAFFNALPDGDRVTVIPFGTEILDLPGYKGTVSPDMRKNLVARAGDLYTNSNLTKEFKAHTDVKKAVEAVASAVRNNRDYKINILVIMTDFRNDVVAPVRSEEERRLTQEEVNDIYATFTAATKDLYTRNIALELPYIDSKGNMSTEKNRSFPGYCLDQLQKGVFPQDGEGKLQIVPVDNSAEGINQWFTQLQREIMVTKLRGVIANENKVAPATVDPEVDIDGNVLARVEWTPTRLYPNLKIDSSYFEEGSEWNFINETESWQVTQNKKIEVELGQIKHKDFLFHNSTDSLQLGLSLPTEYDDELELLNIKKPIPDTKMAANRLLFTFFLPFWLCCAIIAAIILYIILFFKAVARNNALKMSCKVYVTDLETEEEVVSQIRGLDDLNSLSIGASGAAGQKHIPVSGVNWAVLVYKKKGNPFKLFEKPSFRWKSAKNYVCQKKFTEGPLGVGPNMLYGSPKPRADEATHKIKIQRVS